MRQHNHKPDKDKPSEQKKSLILQQQRKLVQALKVIKPGEGIAVERKGTSPKAHVAWKKYTGNMNEFASEIQSEFFNASKSLRKGQILEVTIKKLT